MEGPPLGPGGEDITWPDQLPPRGRKASSTRKIKPQTSNVKKRSPEHLSATLTGCESPNGYLEPAAVKEDADDQLSEIASTIPPVDPSCVELKHSAFLAQQLLEVVDLE